LAERTTESSYADSERCSDVAYRVTALCECREREESNSEKRKDLIEVHVELLAHRERCNGVPGGDNTSLSLPSTVRRESGTLINVNNTRCVMRRHIL
jgi:hypothetical protein